jgi:hypothetical protein
LQYTVDGVSLTKLLDMGGSPFVNGPEPQSVPIIYRDV